MRKKILFSTVSWFLAITAIAFAGGNNVTPYGDYCKDCGTYGTCSNIMSPEKATVAIKKYYREKGYRVGNLRHKGRFIEADIYKNKRQVDKVLFDRKTGRIRSIN